MQPPGRRSPQDDGRGCGGRVRRAESRRVRGDGPRVRAPQTPGVGAVRKLRAGARATSSTRSYRPPAPMARSPSLVYKTVNVGYIIAPDDHTAVRLPLPKRTIGRVKLTASPIIG